MTTPRVTVPVEPTEAMIEAAAGLGLSMIAPDNTPGCVKIYRAMLSAAAAPEGGAVTDALQRLHVLRDQARNGTAVSAPDEYDADELDAILFVIEADLATREAPDWTARTEAAWAENNREESPAEAGEDLRAQVVKLLDELIAHVVAIGPDKPDVNTPMCRRVWREVFADLILALRAQPPAREDAQPVAWRYKLDDETAQALFRPGWNFQEHKPPVQWGPYGRLITEAEPLYTHPAPDALRGAVEALEPFARFAENVDSEGWTSNIHRERISVWFGPSEFRLARQALAALQAEQKGGA